MTESGETVSVVSTCRPIVTALFFPLPQIPTSHYRTSSSMPRPSSPDNPLYNTPLAPMVSFLMFL